MTIRKDQITDTYKTPSGATVTVTNRTVKAEKVKAVTKAGPGKADRKGISLPELFAKFPDDRTAEKWFERKSAGARTGIYCPLCGGLDKITRSQGIASRCRIAAETAVGTSPSASAGSWSDPISDIRSGLSPFFCILRALKGVYRA